MNERTPSLDLAEVGRRFEDTEHMLREARERLVNIVEAQERSRGLADSLSETAQAVQGFSSQAEEALRQVSSAVVEARAVLEAGSELIGGGAFSELREQVSAIQVEVSRLSSAQQELKDSIGRAQSTLLSHLNEKGSRFEAAQFALQASIERAQTELLKSTGDSKSAQEELLNSIGGQIATLASSKDIADVHRRLAGNRRLIFVAAGLLLVGQAVVAVVAMLT